MHTTTCNTSSSLIQHHLSDWPKARHYNAVLSIWLSVDPMSDKYPSLSPYVYCADNPVRIQDPNGDDIWEVNEKGYTRCVEHSDEHKIFFTKGRSENSFGKRITTGMGENKQEVCIDNKNVDEFMKKFHPIKNGGHLAILLDNDDNRSLVKEFMQKLSIYTEVEWGYTGTKDGTLWISTSHKKGEDGCSSEIVQNLDSDKNLSFAFHIQHKYNFASRDDEKIVNNLKCHDDIFGVIYQRRLFDFKGNNIEWPKK